MSILNYFEYLGIFVFLSFAPYLIGKALLKKDSSADEFTYWEVGFTVLVVFVFAPLAVYWQLTNNSI